jgi:alpha-tubulin suppressor-like RCC1 family protein
MRTLARGPFSCLGAFVLLAGSLVLIGANAPSAGAANAGQFAWAWGSVLGNGTSTLSATPVPVAMPRGVTFSEVSAGEVADLALVPSGQAWSWGSNTYGQLGIGSTREKNAPVRVSMPPGLKFTTVSAGDQGQAGDSLALDSTGHAWSWGFNVYGELGNGTTTGPDRCPSGHVSQQPCGTRPSPVLMPPGVTFKAISGGFTFTLALDSTGRAWSWGLNNFGQLGNGTTTGSTTCSGLPCTPTPAAVSMPPGVTFTELAAGGESALALDSQGRVWSWGLNADGELGNGTTTNSSIPVQAMMPSGTTFTSMALGSFNSLALDTTGRAWSWGSNQSGELGTGTTGGPKTCNGNIPCSPVPVAVAMPPGTTFSTVSAGEVNDQALDSNGDAWTWGSNISGQLGNGTTTGPDLCFGLPCSANPVAVLMPADVTFNAVSTGNGTALALTDHNPLAITSTPPPPGSVNMEYSDTLTASGGTPPYKWTIIAGSLPPGLRLFHRTGSLSGKPTATGTFAFTVQVHDHRTFDPATQDFATKTFSLTVS